MNKNVTINAHSRIAVNMFQEILMYKDSGDGDAERFQTLNSPYEYNMLVHYHQTNTASAILDFKKE